MRNQIQIDTSEDPSMIRRLRLIQIVLPCVNAFNVLFFLLVLPAMHFDMSAQMRYMMAAMFAATLPVYIVVCEIMIRKRKRNSVLDQEKSIKSKKW